MDVGDRTVSGVDHSQRGRVYGSTKEQRGARVVSGVAGRRVTARRGHEGETSMTFSILWAISASAKQPAST